MFLTLTDAASILTSPTLHPTSSSLGQFQVLGHPSLTLRIVPLSMLYSSVFVFLLISLARPSPGASFAKFTLSFCDFQFKSMYSVVQLGIHRDFTSFVFDFYSYIFAHECGEHRDASQTGMLRYSQHPVQLVVAELSNSGLTTTYVTFDSTSVVHECNEHHGACHIGMLRYS